MTMEDILRVHVMWVLVAGRISAVVLSRAESLKQNTIILAGINQSLHFLSMPNAKQGRATSSVKVLNGTRPRIEPGSPAPEADMREIGHI